MRMTLLRTARTDGAGHALVCHTFHSDAKNKGLICLAVSHAPVRCMHVTIA
jgi:hypothetical protein